MKTNARDNSIRPILGSLIRVCGLWILFCAAPACAQCENGVCRPGDCRPEDYRPGAASHPAVVRVMNAARNSRYYGTGTLVESDAQSGVVLTCAHLFPGEAGNVVVTFPDGRRAEARLLAADPTWDLAALEIPSSAAKPVAIASAHPQPGEPLRSCGYGSDGRYWCNQGRALGYVRIAASNSYETLELSGSARQGDSGGPVFNQQGELVAVLWGTDGRIVGGTYCGRIRKFLARLLARRQPQSPRPLPDGVTPPQVDPSTPPHGQNERDGGLKKRLDDLAANFQDLHRRMSGQEQSLGQRVQQALEVGVSLRGRLERAEAAVGNDNLRAVVKEMAAGALADHAPSLAAKVLPAVLAALGWTGPPSMALILAARVFAAIWTRRRSASTAPRKARRSPRSRLLQGVQTSSLAGTSSLSGQSSLADATLGREFDRELLNAAESGDATLARWARGVRDRVAQRFYRIHSRAPTSAQPLSSAGGSA